MRCLALFLLAVSLPLFAQYKKKPEPKGSPRVLFALPLATSPGFKGKVVLRGVKLDDATNVKVTDPRIDAKLVGKPRKAGVPKDYSPEKAGDTEVEVELELPVDTTADHISLIVTTPRGASEPFKLVVDGSPRSVEKEPNDSFPQAQEILLPTTVDAVIDRERDVDVYRFTGKVGDKIRVEVKAARLGAPTDAFVVVYDADKRIVDSGDDSDGSADPVLNFKLPRDGVYYVSVIEAHDTGGPLFAYRLQVLKAK